VSCALCLKQKPLQRSHIIPEFVYDALYDDKHRLRVLSSKPDRASRMEQKGFREELLCADCEGLIAKWERYVSLVFSGAITTSSRRDGNLVFVSGVDYAQFKLFQLSVLWRAGVSMLPFFSNVRLGPHEELLRKLIVAADPGDPHDYGCTLYALTKDNGVDRELITQPTQFRMQSVRGYHFLFGGMSWVYFVSSHGVPPGLKAAFVQRSGTFALLPVKSPGEMFIERLARRLHENRTR